MTGVPLRTVSSEERLQILRNLALCYPLTPWQTLLRALEACRLAQGNYQERTADLGCGKGQVASSMGVRFNLGLDIDYRAVLSAKQRGIHDTGLCADICSLPLRDESLATIMCNSVFEHIPDLDVGVSEISRVLQIGGRLYLTVPSQWKEEHLYVPSYYKMRGLMESARDYVEWFRHNWQHHHHGYDISEWRAILARHHLVVMYWTYYEHPDAAYAIDQLRHLSVGVKLDDAGLEEHLTQICSERLSLALVSIVETDIAHNSDKAGSGIFLIAERRTAVDLIDQGGLTDPPH